MSTNNRSVRYWIPRGLGILYTLFISLFTFDAWEGTSSFWEGLLGWFIHLLPVLVVLFVLVVAWGRPRPGGILFLALAAAFAVFFAARFQGDWIEFGLSTLLIVGPLVLMGVLFLLESRKAPPQPSLQA